MTPPRWIGLVFACAALACAGPGERAERSLDVEFPENWVAEALVHNRDLAVTAARVLAAEAETRIVGADGLPQVSAGLSRDRTKRNFIGFPSGPGGSSNPVSRFTSYSLGLSTTWELDVWGRLADAEDAASQDALAAWADHSGAQQSLAAAVLQAWFALVEAERQEQLGQRTLESWSATHALVERRYTQGLRPALDARLTAADVERARAELETFARVRSDAARQLEILLGRYPSAELAAADGELPEPAVAVPDGLPATLISRRADLFAAERRLAAAELLVDVARKDFYPDLTLTGSVGTSSEKLSDLLDGDFTVWRLLGGIVQPIFEGGRLQARLDRQDARAAEQLASFASQVLDALGEVEGALDAERLLERELRIRVAVTEEANRARDLATRRYAEGLVDVSTLLDAERGAYTAESRLLLVRRQRLVARIRLHLALGGGFQAPEANSEAPADASPETPTKSDRPSDGQPEDAP